MPAKLTQAQEAIDKMERKLTRFGHKLSWRIVDDEYATCYCTRCDESGDCDESPRLATPCTGTEDNAY